MVDLQISTAPAIIASRDDIPQQQHCKYNELQLGTPVWVRRKGQAFSQQGVVAYVGLVEFAPEKDWVGVRLTGPLASQGKNSGTVGGVTYFETDIPKSGIFVRRSFLAVRSTAASPAKSSERSPPPPPQSPSPPNRKKSRSQSEIYRHSPDQKKRLEALQAWKQNRNSNNRRSSYHSPASPRAPPPSPSKSSPPRVSKSGPVGWTVSFSPSGDDDDHLFDDAFLKQTIDYMNGSFHKEHEDEETIEFDDQTGVSTIVTLETMEQHWSTPPAVNRKQPQTPEPSSADKNEPLTPKQLEPQFAAKSSTTAAAKSREALGKWKKESEKRNAARKQRLEALAKWKKERKAKLAGDEVPLSPASTAPLSPSPEKTVSAASSEPLEADAPPLMPEDEELDGIRIAANVSPLKESESKENATKNDAVKAAENPKQGSEDEADQFKSASASAASSSEVVEFSPEATEELLETPAFAEADLVKSGHEENEENDDGDESCIASLEKDLADAEEVFNTTTSGDDMQHGLDAILESHTSPVEARPAHPTERDETKAVPVLAEEEEEAVIAAASSFETEVDTSTAVGAATSSSCLQGLLLVYSIFLTVFLFLSYAEKRVASLKLELLQASRAANSKSAGEEEEGNDADQREAKPIQEYGNLKNKRRTGASAAKKQAKPRVLKKLKGAIRSFSGRSKVHPAPKN